MTRKDPAVLWFGSDFYEDEAVLQMSYEQQGVYQRLLWLSNRNEGLPADPAVLAKMLGIPAGRFRARVWPTIAPCWELSDGRLYQRRQEEERARRAAARGDQMGAAERPEVADGQESAQSDRSARMRALAQRSWDARRSRSAAATHAAADAGRNAHADAGRNAARILPPAPPSEASEAKYPRDADAGRNAQRNAAPHAAPEGASAAHAGAEAEQSGDRVPVVQIQRALLFTGLRSNMQGFDRSRALMRIAEALLPTGIAEEDVAELWALAQSESNGDPGALFATWLVDRPAGYWRGVLDERRAKKKERHTRASAGEDREILGGIYGGEPAPAAAVAASMLAGARTTA